MLLIYALLGIICILFCILLYWIMTFKRNLDSMESMIDMGIEGVFEESRFDETRMSRLESKLYKFLCNSALGRKKVESDKNKIEELVSDISHQTKTPITTIRLYAGLLEEENLTERAASMTEQIILQNDKVAFLIDNLVKISRLENGLIIEHPAPRPISDLFDNLKRNYGSIENKTIIFYEENMKAFASYDLKWTAEAVGNMIENAAKYSGEDGKIEISVVPYTMFIGIKVKDNGIGIKEDEQAQIFRRFYRSEQVKDEKGIGIGLYITREIIALEGGYIKVKSEWGKGTEMTVFLPISSS